jgi:hypothetical protein
MVKQYIPIVVFIFLTIFFAILFNKKMQSIFIATILAALTSSIVFQIIGFIITGYMDPFLPTAFVNSLPIALVISSIVGVVYFCYRKLIKTKHEV